MTDDSSESPLLRDLREFARELGKTPTKAELNDFGPHYVKRYQNEFGSWNEAVAAAGLEPNLVHGISRTMLEADIERVAGVLGKTPTLDEMDRYGRFSRQTYQSKLGSYVETLERLGLEPSMNQYNFSNQEKPPALKGTKNVRHLRDHGPTPGSGLPSSSLGSSDKRYGLTKFSINTGQTGAGLSEPVYYLFDDHEPEAVLRAYFERNPQVLENRTRKAIVTEVGTHGRDWRAAAKVVLDEIRPE